MLAEQLQHVVQAAKRKVTLHLSGQHGGGFYCVPGYPERTASFGNRFSQPAEEYFQVPPSYIYAIGCRRHVLLHHSTLSSRFHGYIGTKVKLRPLGQRFVCLQKSCQIVAHAWMNCFAPCFDKMSCDLVHVKTISCNQGAVRAVRYNGKR